MKKIRDDNRVIYNISDDEKDDFCINMLKTNKIKSVLPVSFSDNGDIIYDFSDTVPWSIFTEKKISAEKILVILCNMCKSDIEIRENFLKNNMIVMNEEDVFINPETLDVYFCILPIHEDYENHKVENFIKEILFDIETDAGELIYSIMRQLKNKNYLFTNFYDYIKNQINEISKIQSEPLISNYEETEKININQDLSENENWNVVSLDDMLMSDAEAENVEIKSDSDNGENEKSVDDLWSFLNSNDTLIDSFRKDKDSDKEKDVQSSSENLILQSDSMENISADNKSESGDLSENKKAYLFRQINNEEIEIDKEFFMLGKYRYASYTFNNDSISRTHATIIKENNQYFIVDNDSRNGTFINGRKIQPNNKVKLNNRDLITLSNETLVFYIR